MEKKPIVGRTAWDALTEVFPTWKLLVLVLALVTLVLFLAFLVVHLSAEPGTSVEFLGVIKYQKAKPLPEAPKPDETATFAMPKEAPLLGGKDAIPILDRTLAVRKRSFGADILLGDSIGKIRVGSRRVDGIPLAVQRLDPPAVVFDDGTYIEIEYLGRMYALSVVYHVPGSALVSVEPIPRATLTLHPVKELELHEPLVND